MDDFVEVFNRVWVATLIDRIFSTGADKILTGVAVTASVGFIPSDHLTLVVIVLVLVTSIVLGFFQKRIEHHHNRREIRELIRSELHPPTAVPPVPAPAPTPPTTNLPAGGGYLNYVRSRYGSTH